MNDLAKRAFSHRTIVHALIAVPLGVLISFLLFIGADTFYLQPTESASGVLGASDHSISLAGLGLYLLAAVQVGYVGALVTGVPIHLMLVRFQIDNFAGYAISGVFAAGIVLMVWMWPVLVWDVSITKGEFGGIVLYYCIPSIVIAAVFGMLRSRSERHKN